MPFIELTQGQKAIVCDCHHDLVKGFKWYAAKSRYVLYAQTMGKTRFGWRPTIKMHRLITDAPKGLVVDHINGDGLDNRCTNLRVCTSAENQHNSNKARPYNLSSGYKGISWRVDSKKWRVRAYRGRGFEVGNFVELSEAIKAYNQFVQKIDGGFAKPLEIGRA